MELISKFAKLFLIAEVLINLAIGEMPVHAAAQKFDKISLNEKVSNSSNQKEFNGINYKRVWDTGDVLTDIEYLSIERTLEQYSKNQGIEIAYITYQGAISRAEIRADLDRKREELQLSNKPVFLLGVNFSNLSFDFSHSKEFYFNNEQQIDYIIRPVLLELIPKNHIRAIEIFSKRVAEMEYHQRNSREIWAVNSIKELAKQGDPESQAYYGVARLNGWLEEKNQEEGMYYLRKAAEAGNEIGQYWVGEDCVFRGEYEKAVEYLTKSANQGNPMAMFRLAEKYRNGDKKQKEKAFEYAKASAERGCLSGMDKLIEFYLMRIGTKFDGKSAIAWVNRAMKKGSQTAKCYLGVMYIDGIELDKDIPKGLSLIQEAIDSGSRFAVSVMEAVKKDKQVEKTIKRMNGEAAAY